MIYSIANITVELNNQSNFAIFDVKLDEVALNQRKVGNVTLSS
jgi:hypothetical protein